MGRALRLPPTGGAGLLARERLVFELKRVRAIVMASARHNEGSSRLSERDKTGAIMLAVADTVVANGLSKLFSNGAASNFPINSTFTARSKVRSRSLGLTKCWGHYDSADHRPRFDKHPGNELAKSMSFDNNYEIVEFTAPITGTYSKKISNYRPSSGNRYIGLAGK